MMIMGWSRYKEQQVVKFLGHPKSGKSELAKTRIIKITESPQQIFIIHPDGINRALIPSIKKAYGENILSTIEACLQKI